MDDLSNQTRTFFDARAKSGLCEEYVSQTIEPQRFLYNLTEDTLLKNTLLASQTWALFVAIFGGLGNVTTISSIIYQLRKHTVFCTYNTQNAVLTRRYHRNIRVESVDLTDSVQSVNTVNIFYSEYEDIYDNNKVSSYELKDFAKPVRRSLSTGSLASFHDANSESVCQSRYQIERETAPYCGAQERAISSQSYTEVKTRFYVKKPIFACRGDTLLLLYLSFADLLYCALCLPFTYYVYDQYFHLEYPDETLCSVSAFMRYTIAYGEWLTLGLLAVERCIVLRAKPNQPKFFTFWPTTALIGIIWIISIIAQLIPLFGDKFGYDYTTLKCDFKIGDPNGGRVYNKVFFFSIEAALPTILMIFGCCSIVYQLWKNKRDLVQHGVSNEDVIKKCKENWSFVAITLWLLVLYLVCVLPICIYQVVNLFCQCIPLHYGLIIYMLYWLQYAVNFIVYGIYNKGYRQAYKEFLSFIFLRIFNALGLCNKGLAASEDPHYPPIYYSVESYNSRLPAGRC